MTRIIKFRSWTEIGMPVNISTSQPVMPMARGIIVFASPYLVSPEIVICK